MPDKKKEDVERRKEKIIRESRKEIFRPRGEKKKRPSARARKK